MAENLNTLFVFHIITMTLDETDLHQEHHQNVYITSDFYNTPSYQTHK